MDLSCLNTTPEESPIDPHHPQTALNDYPRAQAELGLGCGQQLRVPTSGIDFGTYLEALGVTTASALIRNSPIFIAALKEFCMKGLGEDLRRKILRINPNLSSV